MKGAGKGNTASLALPRAAVEAHLSDAAARPLIAQVTLPHPGPASSGRSFDVLVNAPGNVTEAAPTARSMPAPSRSSVP